MSALTSAIHNTRHYHVRPRPVCLSSSCTGSANNGHSSRVEVDAKEVRIMGSKSVLLRTLVAASSAKTAGFGVPVLYRTGAPGETRTHHLCLRRIVVGASGPPFRRFFDASRRGTRPKRSRDCADILRTLSDVLGCLPLHGLTIARGARRATDTRPIRAPRR
jgi:hypothetical protein